MMKRRQLAGLLASTFYPITAEAQSRIPRILWLWAGSAGSDAADFAGFQAGLKDLGYEEGRNVSIDRRYGDGSMGKMAEVATASLAVRPNAIVAVAHIATAAAAKLTRDIPVVSITGDLVSAGFAASLARPGGNVTGLTIAVGPEVAGKWLELLLEINPKAQRIAILISGSSWSEALLERMRLEAPTKSALTIDDYRAEHTAGIVGVLEKIGRTKPDALMVANSATLLSKAADIAALGLMAISGDRKFAEAGLLMSYGPRIIEVFRRSASYIDRILKGAKPADLPIEQPTQFELVINLKTAKALGLTIPPSILARADEVIE